MSDSLRIRRATTLALMAAMVLSGGCSESEPTAPFSGTVTYKGQPLEFGSVTFQPKAGGSLARAQIQPDGTFELMTDGRRGAPIGENSVRVTCFANQKPGATADTAGEGSLGKSLIPERYSRFTTSGLTVEVKSGENPPYEIQLTD